MDGTIPVFYPTMEEMEDFSAYISFMERCGAHEVGLAKVVPPKEYVARRNGYDDIGDIMVRGPIEQMVSGRNGLYQVLNVERKSMRASAYKKLATSSKYAPPDTDDNEALERKFWKNITFNSPIYGADTPGTLTDEDMEVWNCSKLDTILNDIADTDGPEIMGVNTAYLYFGMWKAAFCWHTEDMDLYSINYIHFGKSKTWYGVPPSHADKMERVAAGFFSGDAEGCKQFLRHKMSLMSPNVLREYSIPCNKIVHHAGEFMITFPRAYHAGFNHGYNCAESSNFASLRWIDYGKAARPCTCNPDTVRIEMDGFVKKYQPDQWVEPETEAMSDDSSSSSSSSSGSSSSGSSSSSTSSGSSSSAFEPVRIAPPPAKRPKLDPVEARRRRLAREEARRRRAQQLLLDAAIEQEKILNRQLSGADQAKETLTCSVCMLEGKPTVCKPATPPESPLRLKFSFGVKREEAAADAGAVDGTPAAVTTAAATATSMVQPVAAEPLASTADLNLAATAVTAAEADDDLDIITCDLCQVSVHKGCYGVPPGPVHFRCDLCKSKELKRECVLCPNVGGAMKPTTEGRWAHVSCALWVPETTFEDPVTLTPIGNVKRIPKARWKLRCKLCRPHDQPAKPSRLNTGAPIQCNRGSCVTAFHTTCAQRAGYFLRIGFDPTMPSSCEAFCLRHTPDEYTLATKLAEEPAVSLEIGNRVLAKWGGTGYYPGAIASISYVTFCEVRFADGSFAKELELKYVRRQGAQNLPLDEAISNGTTVVFKVDQSVEVEWTDGLYYDGKFISYVQKPKYFVNFEDGYSSTVAANDIVDISNTAVERAAARPQPVLDAAIAGIGDGEPAAAVPSSTAIVMAASPAILAAASGDGAPANVNDAAALASAGNTLVAVDITMATIDATCDGTSGGAAIGAASATATATAVEPAAISTAADDGNAVRPDAGSATGARAAHNPLPPNAASATTVL